MFYEIYQYSVFDSKKKPQITHLFRCGGADFNSIYPVLVKNFFIWIFSLKIKTHKR